MWRIRVRIRRLVALLSECASALCKQYLRFLNAFIKTGLGKGLFYLVYLLLFMIASCEYLVLLPYEAHHRPSLLIPVYYLFGIYLIACICYHHFHACTVDPGRPEPDSNEPLCNFCENHKPDGAHHCSICERCVLQMDHHCVWINQCVGRNNHRFFLQFMVYVWIAQCLILFVNYNAFWEHLKTINRSAQVPYCSGSLELAPWREQLCITMPYFLNSCVCFIYGLAILLFIVLGLFISWNIYLISIGETFINYLQHCELRRVQHGWRSCNDRGAISNWRQFLGIKNKRTFLRHILLPSSHKPVDCSAPLPFAI